MHFFYSKTDHYASGSNILDEFTFINDFGFEEYKDIRQKPLTLHYHEGIEICYVTKGRYEWVVDDQKHLLFPGNGFVTCPWQKHGGSHNVVDLGEIYWIVIKPDIFTEEGIFHLGDWSRFSLDENTLIGNILSKNSNPLIQKAQLFQSLFKDLCQELETKSFGYQKRVCNIVEEFLISSIRLIQCYEDQINKNRNWFENFENILIGDISKKWSLHEMAEMTGVGITTLTQQVKEYTGYTPANYLIYLRVEKAKVELVCSDKSLTNIALDCGFYSSQHFSSTFLKWIGISPSVYRKRSLKSK
jgi:AraC-like DNA-binding protein